MKTVTGIFNSRADAERAVERLRVIGLANDKINLLAPGRGDKHLEAVLTTETEQPGMGKALGGVVGGALGAAGGLSLGTAAASLFVPGVGPVIGIGLAAAALLGVGGAVGGVAVGEALEDSIAKGLPRDEVFVYEDALRRGRTVVVAFPADDAQADAARDALRRAGAESVDAAREEWWVGLRDAEAEHYIAQGRDFKKDELNYRRGFESALQLEARGKPFEETKGYLRERYADCCDEESFRRGYERGQAYYQNFANKLSSKKGG